ncbi:MAG: excalibur calcium-binding domain-containing protein [Allosphingosinicella sp.]
MDLRKPFRADPVRLGPYQAARARRRSRVFVAKILGGAAVFGLAVGMVGTESGRALIPIIIGNASAPGLLPRAGAPAAVYYPRCDYARAAGVAPILAGEPGYRPGLDADSDGIACEPVPGS